MTEAAGAPTVRATYFLRTSGGVIAGRVLGYAGSLITLIVTARELGTAGRGVIALIATLASFGSLLCTLGLPVAARLRLGAPDDPVPLGRFLGLGASLLVVEVVITPTISAVFLPLADVDAGGRLLLAIGTLAALHGALYLLVAALLAYGRLVAASFSDAAGFALQGVLCLVGAATGVRTLTSYVVLLTVGLLPPVVGALVLLRRLGHDLRPQGDRGTWLELLRIGAPSIGTVLGESATFRIDRLILGAFASPSAVGVYSVAATAAEMIRFVPASVAQLVFYDTTRGQLGRGGYLRVRRATVAGVACVGLVAAAAAPTAVRVAVGRDFLGAVTPFRILVLAELGCAIYVLSSSRLSGGGHVAVAAKAAAAGLAVVLIADLALIPPLHATGAAIASVVAYLSMGAVAARFSARAER